jgi:hypothetical protein
LLLTLTAVNSAIGYILNKFEEVMQADWRCMSAELYLQVDYIKQICRYYFVDHQKRTIFWLSEVATELVDVPRTVSLDVACKSCIWLLVIASLFALDLFLADKYWVHVERFGMHLTLPESVHSETSAILKFHLAGMRQLSFLKISIGLMLTIRGVHIKRVNLTIWCR